MKNVFWSKSELCNSEKRGFIKEQEVSGILRWFENKITLSKIHIIGKKLCFRKKQKVILTDYER